MSDLRMALVDWFISTGVDPAPFDNYAHAADDLMLLVARLLTEARESGRSNGYIAGFEAGDARARKVLGGSDVAAEIAAMGHSGGVYMSKVAPEAEGEK